ncbi:MAG: hypothetical protein HY052_07535 [Proteobacteria bacterium]|nr:hypothetical protein [Pseudomonadota bacterium]
MIKSFFQKLMVSSPPPMTRGGFVLVFFLVAFILGYNSVSVMAQVAVPEGACAGCAIEPTPVPCPCEAGEAGSAAGSLSTHIDDKMGDAAGDLEQYISDKTDDMVADLLTSLDTTEQDTIGWWDTMWSDRLQPDLHALVHQVSVAVADQSVVLHTGVDAVNLSENRVVQKESELKDQRAQRVSENVCVAATLSGGYGRANSFATAMRGAWEQQSQAVGLVTSGAGAGSAVAAERQRYDDYKNIFCDPSGNNGANSDCSAPDPAYFNADTLPSKFIYDRLTTDVTADVDPLTGTTKMEKAVETIVNNMVGVPSSDPISLGALQSATGQQVFLERRVYLARYAAIRSVPQIVAGWRMPGSQMGEWVKSVRDAAGIAPASIASNPSYREIMHAASVDRFNSGSYALGMVTDESEIELEKLTLSVFYLMQLRDYYELLERTALTLAVQVSMMVDQTPMPNITAVTPLR